VAVLKPAPIPPDRAETLRPAEIVGTVVASVALALIAANSPPFVPAGANLTVPSQSVFAHNIWPKAETSLAVLAVFLPWLIYAVVRQGRLPGRVLILVIAAVGVVAGIGASVVSLTTICNTPHWS
jgi:hypothetical protein